MSFEQYHVLEFAELAAASSGVVSASPISPVVGNFKAAYIETHPKMRSVKTYQLGNEAYCRFKSTQYVSALPTRTAAFDIAVRPPFKESPRSFKVSCTNSG